MTSFALKYLIEGLKIALYVFKESNFVFRAADACNKKLANKRGS